MLELWRAYYTTYERQGKDPFIGRNLVALLHQAGALLRFSALLFNIHTRSRVELRRRTGIIPGSSCCGAKRR